MGANLSRRPGQSPQPPSMDANGSTSAATAAASSKAQYMAELRSYEAACKVDPSIQSFDNNLHERTSRAISTVTMAVELRSFSFDSLREITGCLLDTNQEVVSIILECKKDVWKNADLFSLVEEYFENSLRTLDFCTALEKCLKKARDSQLIVQVALQCFEEEEAVEGDGMKKYARTLEELKSFKAEGDPFTEEFFRVFQSVYNQQLSMLEKLQLRKKKLDKKLKSVTAWRKVSCIIFVSALAAVVICSVVAAAMAAPPVAAALAAAASVPLGSMGKWFDSLWKKYQDALKGQKELIGTMQVGTFVAIKDLDSIRLLISQLEVQIESLLHAANFAVRDEAAVKFGVGEIKRKLGDFMKSIEDLEKEVAQCTRDVGRARTVVLQRIIKYPK